MFDYELALDFSEYQSLDIGVVSDTHGHLNCDIERFIGQCDIALHAGDIMGATSLDALKPKLNHVIAVKGNNDAPSTWAPQDQHILVDIPDRVELKLPGGILTMEHSHRMWDRDIHIIHRALREEYPDVQLVIYGHTHICTVDDSTTPVVANPGAAGRTRVHDGPSCLMLHVNAHSWEIETVRF